MVILLMDWSLSSDTLCCKVYFDAGAAKSAFLCFLFAREQPIRSLSAELCLHKGTPWAAVVGSRFCLLCGALPVECRTALYCCTRGCATGLGCDFVLRSLSPCPCVLLSCLLSGDLIMLGICCSLPAGFLGTPSCYISVVRLGCVFVFQGPLG